MVPEARKPNVIWILLDACRAPSLSCYGYERRTSPNIDRLAAEGVVFEQTFSQSSRTATSVPSYMTGRYFPLHCLGWRFSNATLARKPAPGEILFPTLMKANGYKTAMFATAPLFRPTDRLWKAFDEVVFWGQGTRSLLQRFEVINTRLLPWIEQHAQEPFFVYVHSVDTHFPHEMIPPFDQWIDPNYDAAQLAPQRHGQGFMRRDGAPFTAEDKEYLRALYDGGILDADTQIGNLLQKLDELRLADNTVVLITADHGQLLAEDGVTVAHAGSADQVMHVPFVIRGPGFPSGKRIPAITENADIYPTLVDLLQLTSDAKPDGKSLVPLLQGDPSAPVHEYVFAAPDRGPYESPVSFVLRTDAAKYEHYLTREEAHLWRVPDDAAARADLLKTNPEEAARLKAKMLAERMPLWQAYLQLPVTAIVLDAAWISSNATPKDAVVDTYIVSNQGEPEALCKDNKWAYTEGKLWSCASQEDAPPLTVAATVPPGRYTVRMGVLNNRSFQGKPASAFLFKVNGESQFRTIVADDLAPEKAKYQLIDLGAYDLANGRFEITFDEGDRQHWACLNAIVLAPISGNQPPDQVLLQDFEPESPEGRSQTEEMMRALGYI